ncbi:MAG: LysE family transporter [Gammaproteobacteria bacterium]
MQSDPNLWLFFILVLGVVVLPGMDMAYVLTSALTNGIAGGAAAVSGVVAGGAVHMIVGATGVAAVLVLFPTAFNLLLIAGAAYIAWLGIGLLRARSALLPAVASRSLSRPVIFRRAMLINLMNPKAYAFVLAVYPMFLRTESRPLGMQALAMSVIVALTQAVVYGGIAVGAGRVGQSLAMRNRAGLLVTQCVGVMLLVAAALTIIGGWRTVESAPVEKCCHIVELRQYTLKPGKRDTLIELFDREFVETQEATGMRIIGQFRDLDRPDRFVWLRGFNDMDARRQALGAFYGGPVWAAHRDAANSTMLDSDNVLLLRPATPVSAFDHDGAARPRLGAPIAPAGLVVADIHYLNAPASAELLELFDDTVAPALSKAGAGILARFVTEHSPNTFPGLPVRENEHVFIWFSRFDDQAAYEEYLEALAGSEFRRLRAALARYESKPVEVLRLAPTARSRLR